MAFFSTAQDRSRAAVLAAAARARMNKDLANQDRQRLQAGLVNPFINNQMYDTTGVPNTVVQAPLVASAAGLKPAAPVASTPVPTPVAPAPAPQPAHQPIAQAYGAFKGPTLGSSPTTTPAPLWESIGGPSVAAQYGGVYTPGLSPQASPPAPSLPASVPSAPGPVDTGLAPAQPQGPPTQVQQRAALPPHKHPAAPIVVGSPVALNRELNYAMFERNRVMQDAQISLSNGDMAGYDASRAKLQLMDATLYNLVGQKAVTRLEDGDPRLLTQIYRQQTGQDYLWQRRSDGKLNLMLNGNIVREGLTVASVANKARNSFSQKHANDVRTAQTALSTKLAIQLLKQRGAFNSAGLKAKAKITAAQLGAAKITSDGVSTYAAFPDGRVFVGTPTQQELGGNTVVVMNWAPAFAAGGEAIQ